MGVVIPVSVVSAWVHGARVLDAADHSWRGGGAIEYMLYGSRFSFPSDTNSSQTWAGNPLGGVIPTIRDVLLPRLRPDSSSSCVTFSFFLKALNALVCSGLIVNSIKCRNHSQQKYGRREN